jgi:SAM-dependent methyltransferase
MVPQMETGFDKYAQKYSDLLQDPIRDRFAPGSTFFFRRKVDLIRDFYRRRGLDTRSVAWLDAGCGQGNLLRLGKEHFAEACGCDPSVSMLQACEGLNTQHQDSPDVLPFDKDRFELVTAVCVFHHVESDQRPALAAEACRVLKPGGIFCIIEHNPLNPVTQLIVSRTPVDADARLLTARTARQVVRSGAMQVLDTTFFLYLPESWYKPLSGVEQLFRRIPLGGQYAVFGQKPTHEPQYVDRS